MQHSRTSQLGPASPSPPPPPPQEGSVFRGTFDFESEPFDWGAGYRRPNIPLKDLVIAELPVRLFTGAPRRCVPLFVWYGVIYIVFFSPVMLSAAAVSLVASLLIEPLYLPLQPPRRAGCRRASGARMRAWLPRWTT